MNQRNLIAFSIALMFAAPTMAADVQLFGFLDQGMSFVHEDLNKGMGQPVGQAAPNVLDANGLVSKQGALTKSTLGTGNVSTWGVKGTEKLSDDLEVIFHLESGFLPDDGTLYGAGSPLFERESSVGLRSKAWGELKFGRMPAMSTGSGTTGLFNSRVNPFGAGWGNMTGGWKFAGSLATARWNNMVNYKTPVMNGVQVHVQHSLGNKNDDTEGTADTDRWTALGVTWTGERAFVAAAVDWLRSSNTASGVKQSEKDSWKAIVGGNMKFEDFKLYGSAQYLKNARSIGGYSTKEWAPVTAAQTTNLGFDSWAFATGVDVPAAGGTFKASVAYGFGENNNVSERNKYDRINAGVGYMYPLSRRTSLYSIAGCFWQDADGQDGSISAREAIVGMMHRF